MASSDDAGVTDGVCSNAVMSRVDLLEELAVAGIADRKRRNAERGNQPGRHVDAQAGTRHFAIPAGD